MHFHAVTYHDGHGNKALGLAELDQDGQHLVTGVFFAEGGDVGNVAAGGATILHDLPHGSPEQGHTFTPGW